MVDIQKIYGVIHGSQISVMWYTSEVFLKPSEELLQELSALPAGTKVGIEDFNPEDLSRLEKITIEGVETSIAEAGTRYWREVVECCQQAGHDIIYLDDAETWLEAARHEIKAHEVAERALAERARIERNPEMLDVLRKKAHEHEAQHMYIHNIVREEKLFEKLAQTAPQVAILGAAHTHFLVGSPEVQAEYGLSIKSHAAEVAPSLKHVHNKVMACWGGDMHGTYAAEYISEGLPRNQLVQNPEIDLSIIADREGSVRKYRAAIHGRITEQTPDYIGTWSPEKPTQGLFEVFITEQDGETIRGTIEDTIGTATFTGKLSNDHIEFDKVYPEAVTNIESPNRGLAGPITFTATKTNGSYIGKWHHEGFSHPFEMKPFEP